METKIYKIYTNNLVATCDFQQFGILTNVDSDKHVQPSFKLRNTKWCTVSSLTVSNIQAISKCSDQAAHMHRLVWAFAGRTYHIFGNPMSRLIHWFKKWIQFLVWIRMAFPWQTNSGPRWDAGLVYNDRLWATTRDYQQCDILTSEDSDLPVQPPVKLRNSKWCSIRSLTVIEYSSD